MPSSMSTGSGSGDGHDGRAERLAPVTYLFGRSPGGARQADHDSPPPAPAAGRGDESREAASGGGPAGEDSPEDAAAEHEDAPKSNGRSPGPARAGRTRSGIDGGRQSKASFAPANNVSMHALARRGMSSREMHDYLLGRDFSADEVETEVARLEGVGLLDDTALAETLVGTLRDRKGLGGAALTAELRRRKLDPIAIEEALSGTGDDESERALEVALKRAPQLRSLDAETAKRRLASFLMRKGYSGSALSHALDGALGQSRISPRGDGGTSRSGGPVFR